MMRRGQSFKSPSSPRTICWSQSSATVRSYASCASYTMRTFFLMLTVATSASAFTAYLRSGHRNMKQRGAMMVSPSPTATSITPANQFSNEGTKDRDVLKLQILQLAASLDRGQSYNPTSGSYYEERMNVARERVERLIKVGSPSKPASLQSIAGEWELVFTTVPHGIFRSSPFFLAIQEAYSIVGTPEKAALFFKLHELQTCSWGISKIGRVAQFIDIKDGTLVSEFDTSIFSLTTIPVLGFGKLLPTFGGCVVTVASCRLVGDSLEGEVQYTTAKQVDGLQGVPGTFGLQVPVGDIWSKLPWNNGRPPVWSIKLKYVDKDFRIMEDRDGELFVYTRPVCPRL